MSGLKNILLAGASGNLGPAVLNEFIAAGTFNLYVLTRSDSKSTFPEGVTVLKTDYSSSSLAAVLKAQPIDAVVNLVAMKSPELEQTQIALIDASKAAGVKRFIPADYGTELTNPEVLEMSAVFTNKATAIEYLEKVKTESFTWSTIVCGPFFDWCLSYGIVGVNIKERKYSMYDDSTAVSATNLSTIGKAIVSLLGNSSRLAATANRRVYIASHTLTQNELLAVLEKVSGEKWKVERKSLEEEEKIARAESAKGNMKALFGLAIIALHKKGYGDISSKLDNDLLGLPKEDLEADIKRVLADAQ